MIQRLILAISAAAALAAAVVVAVVAASFGIYALLKPDFGPAGASGIVAAGFTALFVTLALVAWMKARPRKASASGGGSHDTMARLVQVARERPVIAAGALIAGSMIAMRNPAITALVLKSFFDSKKPQKR